MALKGVQLGLRAWEVSFTVRRVCDIPSNKAPVPLVSPHHGSDRQHDRRLFLGQPLNGELLDLRIGFLYALLVLPVPSLVQY